MKGKWISVEDALPKASDNRQFLVLYEDGCYEVARFCTLLNKVTWNVNYSERQGIIYWQPIELPNLKNNTEKVC